MLHSKSLTWTSFPFELHQVTLTMLPWLNEVAARCLIRHLHLWAIEHVYLKHKPAKQLYPAVLQPYTDGHLEHHHYPHSVIFTITRFQSSEATCCPSIHERTLTFRWMNGTLCSSNEIEEDGELSDTHKRNGSKSDGEWERWGSVFNSLSRSCWEDNQFRWYQKLLIFSLLWLPIKINAGSLLSAFKTLKNLGGGGLVFFFNAFKHFLPHTLILWWLNRGNFRVQLLAKAHFTCRPEQLGIKSLTLCSTSWTTATL